MKQLLSTKILSPKQKEIIPSSGFRLTEYNAINIEYREFSLPGEFDHYIFTSQNAVRGFLRVLDHLQLPKKHAEVLAHSCFCVGQKTSSLLIENGFKITKTVQKSRDLAHFIVKSYKNASFLFICGNLRRAELPDILTKHTVRYKEIIAYNTVYNTRKIPGVFDGVLFFSPSGVQSFVAMNELQGIEAFCIGETTAAEASLFTAKIVVAKNQTTESVIQSALTYFVKKHE
ncbi:MAG: uroporphyrinogen-III synthase [Flavobacteriaceae bacterium]